MPATQTVRSLSRLLAGEGWGEGVSTQRLPKRTEPSPALHLTMQCDLPRKRGRCSEPGAGFRDVQLTLTPTPIGQDMPVPPAVLRGRSSRLSRGGN